MLISTKQYSIHFFFPPPVPTFAACFTNIRRYKLETPASPSLVEGCKVYFNDHQPIEQHITFSSGSQNLRGSVYEGIDYETIDAYRQQAPWRQPSTAELKILAGEVKSMNNSVDVGVLKLPDEILQYVRSSLHLSKVDSGNTMPRIFENPAYSKSIEEILVYLEQYYILSTKELVINRIGMNLPNLTNVSYNARANYYPGLHIDSWDELPLANREVARNRICINLGNENRYLLFVNLSVRHIAEQLNESLDTLDQRYNPKTLAHQFLKTFPNYPIIQLKLAPGEGYIAPTENLIHDGSSEGSTSWDIFFTLRGFFSCCKKQGTV